MLKNVILILMIITMITGCEKVIRPKVKEQDQRKTYRYRVKLHDGCSIQEWVTDINYSSDPFKFEKYYASFNVNGLQKQFNIPLNTEIIYYTIEEISKQEIASWNKPKDNKQKGTLKNPNWNRWGN